jgi:F-type H+-transporting ATPase subunit a
VEKPRRWRWGVNRWFVLIFIILNVFASIAYPPVLPHIQLPAEAYSHEPLFILPIIGEFHWTNTLTAMLIADAILLLIAFSVHQATQSGNLVPSGFSGAVEALLEVLYNLTETTAGKWAKSIFPYFTTITLFVLIINWMELLPGVDSIGILEHTQPGFQTKAVFPGVVTILKNEVDQGGSALIPFVRVLSTDLNFTVGLAIFAVFMTQVLGIRALGISYFTKFLNVKTFFSIPVFGVIDFAVGVLELISEFSKILSFSFRLFGNIFAGSVLLFVIGTLIPYFAQTFVLLLEFLVGLIQAVVFGMLTMVFMSQATQGHGELEEVH